LLQDKCGIIEFTAEKGGITCGEFLRQCGVSRRLVTKLKRVPMGITRNGELIRTVDIVCGGDTIVLKALDESLLEPNAGLAVPVAYEDDNIIIFNKPAGMPVHPSIKHQGDTLGNCFAAMYPQLTFRPINRLDKDTSGLCAVAKNAHSANVYGGAIDKVYYAVTEGRPVPVKKIDGIEWTETNEGQYRISAPIGRAGESIIRREIRSDGQYAVTNYTIIKGVENYSLVRVVLETGRTHQIRVHFSSVGHPLAGDDFYGGSLEHCRVQALHCGEMSFLSFENEKISVCCPLREDMSALLDEKQN